MLDELQRTVTRVGAVDWIYGSSSADEGRCELSVIVPTRNEAGNIGELVQRIQAAVGPHKVEIVFVDDSDDETPDAIRAIGEQTSLWIRLLHREPGQRNDGLGGAVLEGFGSTLGEWVCVMDADLQHPPEVLPLLMGRASAAGRRPGGGQPVCGCGEHGGVQRNA